MTLPLDTHTARSKWEKHTKMYVTTSGIVLVIILRSVRYVTKPIGSTLLLKGMIERGSEEVGQSKVPCFITPSIAVA